MAAITSIAAGITAAATAFSTRESVMAKKRAEGVAEAEQVRIGEAKKKALSERKDLIKAQRRQIGADGDFTTNPTGAGGIETVNQGLLG